MGQFSPLVPTSGAGAPLRTSPSRASFLPQGRQLSPAAGLLARTNLISGFTFSSSSSSLSLSCTPLALAASTRGGHTRQNHTSARAPPPPSSSPPATLRTHPWRYILTFSALHPLLHYTVFFPPIYILCSHTNLVPWVLTGPSGVMLLKTPIPDWIPSGTVYGLRDVRKRFDARSNKRGATTPTIEDWMEVTIQKSLAGTIRTGKSLAGMIRSVRSQVPDKVPSLDDIRNVKEDEMESTARGGSRRQKWFADHAQDVRIRGVLDGLTAWLVVKALFPLRLPVTLWITPRVVRMMLRR